MKFIILTILKLDGDESKKTRLGKVAICVDDIEFIASIVDKYDIIVNDAVDIITKSSQQIRVVGTIESILEEIKALTYENS